MYTDIKNSLDQARARRGAMWQNDFFANLTMQAEDAPTFDYDPSGGNFVFSDISPLKGMSEYWNEYKNAAKSRGVVPDYAAFMQQYNAVKTQRNSKLLDRFAEKTAQFSGSKNFDIDLVNELKTNAELRNSLITAYRANPDNPNAASALSYLTKASEPTSPVSSVLGGTVKTAMPWIPGVTEMPEFRKWSGQGFEEGIPGSGAARTIAGGLTAAGAYFGGKGIKEAGSAGIKALIPGRGIKQGYQGIRKTGLSGFRATNDQIKQVLSKSTGVDFTKKNALSNMASKNPKAFSALVDNMEKKILANKGIDASKAFNPDGSINKKWLKKSGLNASEKTQLKNLSDMKKSAFKLDNRKMYDEALKEAKAKGLKGAYANEYAANKVAGQTKTFQPTAKKVQQSKIKTTVAKAEKSMMKQFSSAVSKKGGTSGFIKWVGKNYGWKRAIGLSAKLGISGIGKLGSAATGGLSGAASLALDAWTLYEIADIINDALNEPKGLKGADKDATAPKKSSFKSSI